MIRTRVHVPPYPMAMDMLFNNSDAFSYILLTFILFVPITMAIVRVIMAFVDHYLK